MKGVVLGINPDAVLVDLSHEVPPQDIAHGAFALGMACRHFPERTIHLAVVDPGVGSARRAVVLVTPEASFVGPDNGLLTYAVKDYVGSEEFGLEDSGFLEPISLNVPSRCQVFELNHEEFWRHSVSDTFHGRDVFAPVAAHLSLGVSPDSLGDRLYELVGLNVPEPVEVDEGIMGWVIHVDNFGSLVTNIRFRNLPCGEIMSYIAGTAIAGLSRTYSEGSGLMTLVGSDGYVEIAEFNGNAARRLGLGVGAPVEIRAR